MIIITMMGNALGRSRRKKEQASGLTSIGSVDILVVNPYLSPLSQWERGKGMRVENREDVKAEPSQNAIQGFGMNSNANVHRKLSHKSK